MGMFVLALTQELRVVPPALLNLSTLSITLSSLNHLDQTPNAKPTDRAREQGRVQRVLKEGIACSQLSVEDVAHGGRVSPLAVEAIRILPSNSYPVRLPSSASYSSAYSSASFRKQHRSPVVIKRRGLRRRCVMRVAA